MTVEVVVPDSKTPFNTTLPKGTTSFVVVFKGNKTTGYDWELVPQQPLPNGFKLVNQIYKPDPVQNPPVMGAGGTYRFTFTTSTAPVGKTVEFLFQNKRSWETHPVKKAKVVVSWSA
ncbi:hypothetical protein BCR33DRAFT_736445 [Rhizoclosmatium globosum]|uniref:Proteinase inhibitor I42 chagasin domain-containing protein n=1 Tax=Rhizoclosmatium globosum TaxID=329046 RepID=A0A1Y2CIV8_9FUNG|nr:hypothetical protein BCR33DRAFT_736445 [Rhizoclosmatium globosum]|eukprot:ORY46952.1 hypothetical protein BCR33DRAFT_736445 [Rhizoclosmatium globosum]